MLYDVKNIITKIHNEKNELSKIENKLKKEIEQMDSWWKGTAAKSFFESYLKAGCEMSKLYSNINSLENELGKLVTEVQRADDVKQQVEADKKKKEQSKNSTC